MAERPADRPPHLLHVFATFVPAGPQLRVVRLIEAFGARFRHTIVAMDGRDDCARLLPGEEIARVVPPPGRAGSALRAIQLRRMYRELEPDLLLTYNWGSFDAVLAARTRPGLPHIHHEDGFNRDEAQQQKSRRVWMRRLFLRGARRVVVCSRNLHQIALESWRLPAEKVELIENGIDTRQFAPGPAADARRDLGIPDGALVVGTVGHLRPVKNFARLIEACSRIGSEATGGRPMVLLIVGDGPERAGLEQQASNLEAGGRRVVFAGHREDLREIYRAMDLFALSSDSEQHPLALLEAMSSGLAVTSTDVGDVRSILPQAQHEFLVSLSGNSTTDLAAACERLAGDPELCARLGVENRSRVQERYAFEVMRDAYAGLYQHALS